MRSSRQQILLTGDLDFCASAGLRQTLQSAENPVTIDLSNVRLISAAAIGEFMRLAKRIGCDNVTLANPTALVRRVLELTRVDAVICVVETHENAA